MTRRLLVLLALLALLPACGGLPLPRGVQVPGDVGAEQPAAGGIVVVPPGPQPGMTALQLVIGYLFALSVSPEDDHAVARSYLAPGVQCCQGGEAVLYRLPSRRIAVDAQDPLLVRVSFDSVGRILADGSYRLEQRALRDQFVVTRVGTELRLAEVPRGLRLLEGDLERSFTAYDVHFLRRSDAQASTARLVPDQVFLPVTADPAQAMVDALLRGATLGLQAAVQSAAPPGTTARVRTDGGVVTVDLSGQARSLDARARQRLSAQLVWTLVPTFTGVRLLVDGEPFQVRGGGELQDRADWPEYDPAGISEEAPLLFLRDRRLQTLDRTLDVSPVTTGALPVDEAALSPGTAQLAVRTRTAEAVDLVRTGPLGGPFGEPVLRARGLSSLSWGPGDQGLWLLQQGSPSLVWLVPGPAAPSRAPQLVPYTAPAGAGRLTALEISRDGARAALVLGGRLYVGRVEPTSSGLRLAGIARVSRELVGVTDVAWQSGTSLVALGSLESGEQRFPASIAVDGSSFAVVQRPLVGAEAVDIAAAPRHPLVVAADVQGERQLFEDNGTLFRQQQPGSAPFYPG